MFKKTRLQLTILNSIVFILLLSGLGAVIYTYTSKEVYQDVDSSLKEEVNRISQMGEIRAANPEANIIVWSEDGEILDSTGPYSSAVSENTDVFYIEEMDEIQEIESDGSTFHSIMHSYPVGGQTVNIQIIKNTDAEDNMLDMLFVIIAAGTIFTSLLAVILGYFLAGRALVPIQRAWNNQQQFVSDASHELRTPLAVIQSKSELLFQHPDATIEEKAVDISVISKETRRLRKLVTNLLVLARSDSNQLEIEKMSFNLDELAEEVAEEYQIIAEMQQKELTITAEKGLEVEADKERIHQLLVILIDNALKFTEEQGRICIRCEKKGNGVLLSVADDGYGIPAEEIPHIFKRFYQVDAARTGNQGSGLGLSIAEWIVRKHHGTIQVKSALHKGTTFEVRL